MEGVKDYLCTDLPENRGERAKGLLQFGEVWRVFSSLFPANFNPLQPCYCSENMIFLGRICFKAYQDPFKRSIKTLWGLLSFVEPGKILRSYFYGKLLNPTLAQ